jgi:hypothetical protein
MRIRINAINLKYRYPKNQANCNTPQFIGKPDRNPFDRDDLYEVLPMLEALMDALRSEDENVLHIIEDIINYDLPRSIRARDEVFDFLLEETRERLSLYLIPLLVSP